MKITFPKYDYVDMVDAQYRLLKEGIGVEHLRVVIGNSMGGMHTWIWGERYPDFMDALVPMGSQPTAMAARNWICGGSCWTRSATIPIIRAATTRTSRG